MKTRISRRDFLKASALAGTALCMGMKKSNPIIIDSSIGKQTIDQSGSAIGVVRMEVEKSYSGIGGLLQEYLNHSNAGAWDKIRAKIDYTYKNIDLALAPLEAETGFRKEIQSRVDNGQKLLFKPNLVNIRCINPETNGPDTGTTACTEWAFMAALMRWFHDKLEISYHRMSLGEAATSMPSAAAVYSKTNPERKVITPEATIEGKIGNFHCGWGFYFTRKYLAESLTGNGKDDPMKGYEESIAGTYLAPGRVLDKLMVYDLNRIFDDPNKGREIEVPNGVNFKSIILHKVVVGGSADDSKDMADYPGSILVNVPKLKVHAVTLFTGVIKNLGIGLYPMQSAKKGNRQWDYSVPPNAIPGTKGALPHQVWVGELDLKSGTPKRDEKGEYVVRKTGGITATMIDIIKAVKSQGIFMFHVVDGIETINIDHGGVLGKKEPEGIVLAGLDPVATDLLGVRYMFSNVQLKEAVELGMNDGNGGLFPQKVPLPAVEGKNIITQTGFDCPISRDVCLGNAEKNGLGVRKYYVVGKDAAVDSTLVTVQGHLGTLRDGAFSDLITKSLYFDAFKVPWDLQQTALHYFSAVDQLSGSSLKKDFLKAFDETGDGIVTYEEFGKRWATGFSVSSAGFSLSESGANPSGSLRIFFIRASRMLKASDRLWNLQGHDIFRDRRYGDACFTAYNMSKRQTEASDPFIHGLNWGKGKWPSFQLAWYIYLGANLYGNQFPSRIILPSLFGYAFRYADLKQNSGKYVGKNPGRPNQDALDKYISELKEEKTKPLDFTFYVPAGYDVIETAKVPNVEATSDPDKILTAIFSGGKEEWTAL